MVSKTSLLACYWVSAVLVASSNLANDILEASGDQLVRRTTATTVTVASVSTTAPSSIQTPDPKHGNWGQCGGIHWPGLTVCAAPNTCVVVCKLLCSMCAGSSVIVLKYLQFIITTVKKGRVERFSKRLAIDRISVNWNVFTVHAISWRTEPTTVLLPHCPESVQ